MAEIRPELSEAPERHLRMISFSLARELFGFEIKFISQVIEPGKLAFVPRAPFFLKGVLNYRGKVIAVLDLGQFLGLPSKEPDAESRVLILDPAQCGADFHLGFLVDRVERIETVPAHRAIANPEGEKPYISGAVNLGGRIFHLIALEKLLKEIEGYFG